MDYRLSNSSNAHYRRQGLVSFVLYDVGARMEVELRVVGIAIR